MSYVDANIGKVLTALEALGFADNTVVALLADHGYQLGEHEMWEKYTNWELATRVPFIIADPFKVRYKLSAVLCIHAKVSTFCICSDTTSHHYVSSCFCNVDDEHFSLGRSKCQPFVNVSILLMEF